MSSARPAWLAALLVSILCAPGHVAANEPAAAPARVELNLFVMSHCPWGVRAEDVIIPVVRSLKPLVDLRLYFIGDENPGEAANNTQRFSSMHGEPEVADDLRQVCAKQLAPEQYLDYILERNKTISDEHWQDAATRAGLSADAIKSIEACASSPDGARLLAENLKVHREKNARASPTIEIDGTPYNGARGLRSMTLAVCDALKTKGATLPEACAKAESLPPDPVPTASGCQPQAAQAAAGDAGCGGGCGGCGGGCGANPGVQMRAPSDGPQLPLLNRVTPSNVPLSIHLVVDRSCAICLPKLEPTLRYLFPAATISTLDSSSQDGKKLIARTHATRLPLYVLDAGVERAPSYGQLRPMFEKVEELYMVRPSVTMASVHLERNRVPNHVDIFASSLAPTTPILDAHVLHVLSVTHSKRLTISMHYLVQETVTGEHRVAGGREADSARAAAVDEIRKPSPGPLIATGGAPELQEDIRQACLFQHVPLADFFTYLECRNQALSDSDRANACLHPSDSLKRCIDGPEGETLLRADARLARELGVVAGPVMLWENRYGPFGWNELDLLEGLIDGQH